jgi:predicted enzyme related to lactoylglutathione lyase
MAAGEVRYLQLPALDAEASATFYATVFGWRIRTKPAGERAFDDPSGRISGAWRTDRTPAGDAGVLVWVRVDDVAATLERITSAGGEVVSPLTEQGPGEAIATFRDPAGNVLGLFHEGRSAR